MIEWFIMGVLIGVAGVYGLQWIDGFECWKHKPNPHEIARKIKEG